MNDDKEVIYAIIPVFAATAVVVLIGFMAGRGCNRPIPPDERLLRTEFERGRLQGMQDSMKLLGDLGMEGKVVHMGLPVGSNRWMNMKYEVIHPGLTVEQASNLWFAAMFAKTNSTSITISNASEKTITVTFPKPYEAKEAKP